MSGGQCDHLSPKNKLRTHHRTLRPTPKPVDHGVGHLHTGTKALTGGPEPHLSDVLAAPTAACRSLYTGSPVRPGTPPSASPGRALPSASCCIEPWIRACGHTGGGSRPSMRPHGGPTHGGPVSGSFLRTPPSQLTAGPRGPGEGSGTVPACEGARVGMCESTGAGLRAEGRRGSPSVSENPGSGWPPLASCRW